MFLDLKGNRVEILLFLEQNRSSIVVPVVAEMLFNLIFDVWVDVFSTAEGLVADLLDESKPVLEVVFVVGEVTGLDR